MRRPHPSNSFGFTQYIAVLAVLMIVILGSIAFFTIKHSSQKSQSTKSTKTTTFVFKGLGVEINLPESLKTLAADDATSGTLNDGRKIVDTNVSTDTLSVLNSTIHDPEASCSIDFLGSLERAEGTYVNDSDTILAKQFDGFYIDYFKTPNGNFCDPHASYTKQWLKAQDDLIAAFSSMRITQ